MKRYIIIATLCALVTGIQLGKMQAKGTQSVPGLQELLAELRLRQWSANESKPILSEEEAAAVDPDEVHDTGCLVGKFVRRQDGKVTCSACGREKINLIQDNR